MTNHHPPSSLRATLTLRRADTQLLITHHNDDVVRACLPCAPSHRNSLQRLLEGIALWHDQHIDVALVAAASCPHSRVSAFLGDDLVEPKLAPYRVRVHREIAAPRRLRGPGDFRNLYAIHGRRR